jgi:peptidyl-prolyl cis-trans isomerase B (cyclophilin B)
MSSALQATCNRRTAIRSSLVSAFILGGGSAPSQAAYLDPSLEMPRITKRVYLDVQVGEQAVDRLVVGLFGELMPRTTENFEALCRDNSYAGTTFYRVISSITIQGGAIGDATGKTGRSSFAGAPFEPDNFDLKHSVAGLVSAVRGIGGAVDSRFFITLSDDAGWADDRYAAFGIIQEGMDIVRKIDRVDVKPPQNRPTVAVKIVASGVL